MIDVMKRGFYVVGIEVRYGLSNVDALSSRWRLFDFVLGVGCSVGYDFQFASYSKKVPPKIWLQQLVWDVG